MRFSAVLLAGGKSSRMGRDKAFLEFEGDPLWRRQIRTLRQLSPEQLLIAGPRRAEWRDFEIVADAIPEAGPLAGVAAALRKCATPHLVVLAIDLPEMTANFFRALLTFCSVEQGVVPRSPQGFEPLAAVYPIRCSSLAAASLRNGDFSMQRFVRSALDEELLLERRISPAEISLFANLNTPNDYERSRERETHHRR